MSQIRWIPLGILVATAWIATSVTVTVADEARVGADRYATWPQGAPPPGTNETADLAAPGERILLLVGAGHVHLPR